jgi:outer membrane receptor protein involved in Fe transport
MSRAALFMALLCLGVFSAEAQTSSAESPRPREDTAGTRPRAESREPLQRRISIHVRDISLRDALDRVALLAGIRLSYSGENLPLDRRVSISRDTSSVADVLDDLLRPFPVQPVAVASDHVVLTPREPTAKDSAAHGVAVLDRIVVTGSVLGASERPLPIALDVVRGRDIERRHETDLSKVLDGGVPGVWVWEQSPSSMLARYASVRGASSFGASSPKVYIDGIEVANPLLFTQLMPELVERVEVIRGPQGAALYGADAISGVVNIVSRHEGTATDGSHARIRSEAGYASAFNSSAIAVQEHALTIRGGSNLRSGGITIGASTSGAYIPQAYSRDFKSIADTRVIGAHSTFTANARFYAKNAGVPPSPLLVALNPDSISADANPQQLRLYAIGTTLTVAPTDRWTYSMTGGLDGYKLANVPNDLASTPFAVDTALRDASGSATRGTMRASAVTTVGAPERIATTFTFGAEQSVLRDKSARQISALPPADVVTWSSNTGFSAQANVAILNAAYITAGLRQERIGQTTGLSQDATLPMLGASIVHDYSLATLKFRGAYGKGVRAPYSAFATKEPRRTLANPNLAPEEQSGFEAGADLIFARRLGLHLTRFDQRAFGLIQTVTIVDPACGPAPSGKTAQCYQQQNVGEVSNRGWEAQASLALGSLWLSSAATLVSSRVEKTTRLYAYTGDLRPGDRMLAVPARTFSATASWDRGGFQLSSTVSRATDWINYDRLALAKAWLLAGGNATNFSGVKLRQYWASYTGAAHVRSAMTYDVWQGMLLTLTGENLLNYQRGEPDTMTIVPGRTITLGVRARF